MGIGPPKHRCVTAAVESAEAGAGATETHWGVGTGFDMHDRRKVAIDGFEFRHFEVVMNDMAGLGWGENPLDIMA